MHETVNDNGCFIDCRLLAVLTAIIFNVFVVVNKEKKRWCFYFGKYGKETCVYIKIFDSRMNLK